MACGHSPVECARDVDVIHEAFDVERQVRGVGAHEFLQFLALLVEPHQSAGLRSHVQLVLLRKLLTEVLDQHLIEVFTAQLMVKRRTQDLR